MKTLILIDVQNDFMPGGALEVPGGDDIVKVINEIQAQFDLIIATQDWHPADHKSFASNHQNKKPFETINLQGFEQTLWPDHCVQGSKGADFHPLLNTDPIETIFYKGVDVDVDSYSGFYDNGHQKSTGMASYLREKNAADLFFCGLAAEICVYYSIKDALAEGFHCYFIEDASRPLNVAQYEKMKQELLVLGVTIISSPQISLYQMDCLRESEPGALASGTLFNFPLPKGQASDQL